MTSLMRPRLFAGAALLLALGGALQFLGSAKADNQTSTPTSRPSAADGRNLILGSKDSAQPQNMDQLLTAVTKDVDAYWSKTFKDSGLPEPKVGYAWPDRSQRLR